MLMENNNDLSSTVVAKSDQLNADELIDPITITVTRVDKVTAKDQPVHIHAAGIQPYKPCLTMRRILIAAWGKYKDEWVGRSMVLYCDPEVMWAGKEQGGVRVSHVSHITEPVSRMLAVTRGRKKLFTLLPLVIEAVDYSEEIAKYKATADGDEKQKLWDTLNEGQQNAIIEEFNQQEQS
jgi:hypothetical protein